MARKSRGTIYRQNNGKMYWLLYYVNGQRIRRSLGTADRREAEAKRQEIIGKLQTADLRQKLLAVAQDVQQIDAELAKEAEASRPRISFAEAWPAYLRATRRPQSGEHTLADYERHWTRFSGWITQRGRAAIEETTEDDADAYMEYCRDTLKLGPNRYNKTVQALKLVFRVLSPACGGMANPFQNATKQPLDPHPHRNLSDAELRSVCTTAEGELRTLLALGVYCGFRMADACLLQWNEVDFDRNLVLRVPSKTRSRKNKPVVIPIHPALRTILEETPAEMRKGDILPGFAEQYRKDAGKKTSQAVTEHFHRCGLVTQGKREGRRRAAVTVSFHSLRHTFVSMCARAGVSLPVVREMAGHHSEAIQRVYLHVSEPECRAAINALPSLECASGSSPQPEDELRVRVRKLVDDAPAVKLLAVLSLLERPEIAAPDQAEAPPAVPA
jgi:integrase